MNLRTVGRGSGNEGEDSALHVQTRQTLLRLLRRRQIERKTIGGLLIYLASEPAERERQQRLFAGLSREEVEPERCES